MDRWKSRAPCAGCALGALSGAVFLGNPWWAALWLFGALLLAPKHLGWKFGVLVIALLVAWRDDGLVGEMEKAREFAGEFHSERAISGELLVGRERKQGNRERYGMLQTNEGIIKVLLPGHQFTTPGEVFEIKGTLYLPEEARNPGELSEREYWRENYLAAGLWVDERERKGERFGYGIVHLAEHLRDWLRQTITRGLEDDERARRIILAMVIGEAPSRDSEITEAFRFSGAMHVFAVSGLHVNVVGALFWFGFMVLGISRRRAIAGVIIAMFLYALITGGRPPAMRAALMAAFFLGAFFFRRRQSLFNALALSLIIVVLIHPAQVRAVGFQLSYGVLAAIGAGFHLFFQWVKPIGEGDPFMPRILLTKSAAGFLSLRRYVAAGLATSIPAWLGSLPLMFWKFGLVAPVSILASVLLIPLTFGVLALALLSALMGPVSYTLSEGVNQVNRGAAHLSYGIAWSFSKMPAGHFQLPRNAPADLVVFDTGDGGAASYLAVADGVLIDVGSEEVFYKIVRPALHRWRAPVEHLVLTHPDARHIGGLEGVVRTLQPKDALIPVMRARSQAYQEFIDSAEEKKCSLKLAEKGGRYEVNSETWFETIRQGLTADRQADDRGMIVRLHQNGWRILFTGDVGFQTEEELLDQDISCDLIVMGRHKEHGYSGTADFLKATGAKGVIISGGHFPSTERVPDRWRKMVEEMGVALFWQKKTGGVLVNFGDEELEVWSHLQPEKRLLLKKR